MFTKIGHKANAMLNPGETNLRSDGNPIPVVGELLERESAEETTRRIHQEQWGKLLSFWTDNVFEVPGLGWRFGLDPIIGLVPVIGDLATTLVSVYILSIATQMRVPRSTVARMTLNLALDYVLGSIPVIGNVFDFAWKANHRNMQLLERALNMPMEARRRQTHWDWLFIGGVVALLLAAFVGSLAVAIVVARWIGNWLLGT
jgi:hypothetical protein